MTDTGEMVKACRLGRKWTKVKLSEVSGISLDTIVNIERHRNCNFQTFEALIEAMGFEIEIIPSEQRMFDK